MHFVIVWHHFPIFRIHQIFSRLKKDVKDKDEEVNEGGMKTDKFDNDNASDKNENKHLH
jgi:hypothetical protein